MRGENSSRMAGIFKWLVLIFLVAASTTVIVSLVSLTPVSGQTGATDAAVLTKQLEFILKMNSAFLGFLGVIGALLTWFFKNNLEDAKKVTREIVRQELSAHLKPLIDEEARYLERTLRIEQVVGETVVDYYLASTQTDPPHEFRLLEARGFKVRFWNQDSAFRRRPGRVLVLDFSNSPENQRYLEVDDKDKDKQELSFKTLENLVNQTLEDWIDTRLRGRMPVLVIYVRPGRMRIQAIDNLSNDFPKVKHYTAANTPIALMGWVVDSAYVAFGERMMAS